MTKYIPLLILVTLLSLACQAVGNVTNPRALSIQQQLDTIAQATLQLQVEQQTLAQELQTLLPSEEK